MTTSATRTTTSPPSPSLTTTSSPSSPPSPSPSPTPTPSPGLNSCNSSTTATTTINLCNEKEVMEEFISCYRHFPALWNSSCSDYLSTEKKAPGYQELLKILRRINSECSVYDVKRKINSLRSCYRREYKKIYKSHDGYQPRLWWFHMMDFLMPVLNLKPLSHRKYQQSSESINEIPNQHGNFNWADEVIMNYSLMAQPCSTTDTARWQEFLRLYHLHDANDGKLALDKPERRQKPVSSAEHQLDQNISGNDDEFFCEQPYEIEVDALNLNGSGADGDESVQDTLKVKNKVHQLSKRNGPRGGQRDLHSDKKWAKISIKRNAIKRQRQVQKPYPNDDDYSDDDNDDVDENNDYMTAKKRRSQKITDHQTESECVLIGKRMAAHFRKMRHDQRLYAERIISEVLVYGRMNRLTLEAKFLPSS